MYYVGKMYLHKIISKKKKLYRYQNKCLIFRLLDKNNAVN